MKLPTVTPLVQKYPSAYYSYTADSHYVMFKGVRTQHATQDEALQACERINKQHNLPDINALKSSIYD